MKQVDIDTLTGAQIEALEKAKASDEVDCGNFKIRAVDYDCDEASCDQCVFDDCDGECMELCDGISFQYIEKPPLNIPEELREAVREFEEREGVTDTSAEIEYNPPHPTYYQKAITKMERALRHGDNAYGDTFEESLDHRNITHQLLKGIGHSCKHLDGEEIAEGDDGISHLAFNALRAISALALQIKEREDGREMQ